MKIVHSFKSKTFGKRKMICSKLNAGMEVAKGKGYPVVFYDREVIINQERGREIICRKLAA